MGIEMKDRQVFYEISNDVMNITIDNPEMKNGLNHIGINQLADCFEKMKKQCIKVAVIRGSGDYFFTGGRVDPTVDGEQQKYADAIERYERLLSENVTPLIAAVSGHCLKAGMGLLAACDFAVAKKGVEFGFPEVRMGGVPMMVMASTIDTMPKKRALEAYLTSWNFSAEDAYMMGLVNRVVSPEMFERTVSDFVDVFLNTPEVLVSMTIKAFRELSRIDGTKDRAKFAMRMLREEVLPAMATMKTEYNV